jgi:methyl-accepting chemotaxis protein
VSQVKQEAEQRLIPPIVVSYLALVILVLLVSGFLTRPLRRVTHAAERIAEGDYTQRLSDLKPARVDDEISTLTRVFEVMVAKVREREQVLVQKLERLTIQIDESKRKQEVDQIVESDFFQSLQGRADEMRRRRTSRSETDSISDEDSG